MKNRMLIEKLLNKQAKKSFRGNNYGARHVVAWNSSAVGRLITDLARYADEYSKLYPDSCLADDYVIGAAWFRGLSAVRVLLNGELGGLDGGFCDEIILALANLNGLDLEL